MDAINLLTNDHRTVDSMFDQYQQTDDASERRQLVDTMIRELSIHAAIEEQELYPVMRQAMDDGEQIEEAAHEHAMAKAVLATLAQLQPDDASFDELVGQLISDVRHHVEEEENDLLPRLRNAVSDDELEQLGDRLDKAKRSAPTEPTAQELEPLTVDELQQLAQMIDLDNRSQMNKQQLIAALTP